MKKILLIALLLMPFSLLKAQVATDSAQVEQKQRKGKKSFYDHRVNFGIKAGINSNRLSTRLPAYFNDNYIGFNGGLFARFNIRRFHIQPELTFSMTGGEGVFNGNGGYYAVRLNSIELPVMAGFKVLDFRLVNLRVAAGGWISYHVMKDVTVNDPSNPSNNAFSSADASGFNGGIIVGGGLDIWRFTLDLRYKWGFVNVLGDNILIQDPGAGFKTGTFDVGIGFKIF